MGSRSYYYDFFLESWNINDAIELTREILERFNVPYREDTLRKINNIRDYPMALQVTESIEKMEPAWRYRHRGHAKDFGQKVKNELIRLWSVPKTTAELLEFFVVATGSKNILEIGTSAGYSTLYLAMGAAYLAGKVDTIEKLEPKVKLARKNFRNSGLRNVRIFSGNALDFLKSGKFQKVDLVFLDADKENYGKYFELCMPLLKKGGFIVADNVYDYGHLMKDYLDEVLGTKLPNSQSDKRVQSYTLPIDNGVIFTRKVKG